MKISHRIVGLQAAPADFAPAILRMQKDAPSPLPRVFVYTISALFVVLLVWATFGKLDVIAIAQGKLVPISYLQMVQPADSGIIKELLVREGDLVKTGQALVRMDAAISQAESRELQNELRVKSLQLRRIDAELAGQEPRRAADDPPELYSQMLSQYRARRQAYLDMLETEQALLTKAEQDLKSAQEVEAKLRQTLPIFEDQERSWDKLVKEGFAGRLQAEERRRQRIEVEQELKAQSHAIVGYRASIQQSSKRIAQITSNYRQQLQNERIDTAAQLHKLEQEWSKQTRRHELLELKAPQDGIVKDLATHTVGAVLQPGTVLMTLVPSGEPLRAEVWVSNQDIGFVREGQRVKLKIAPYPFQKYGMLAGTVKHVSADAADSSERNGGRQPDAARDADFHFKTIIGLDRQVLESGDTKHRLSPGMQVTAEIDLGDRTVMEYLLSPVQKAFQEAGRER